MGQRDSLSAGCLSRAPLDVPETRRVWSFSSDNALEALDARAAFAAAFRECRGTESDDAAPQIVFGELVANVVRHAPGPIEITLAVDGAYAVLTVADTGSGFAYAPALPRDPLRESGRGLFIISRYAREICVTHKPGGGTSVRAVLPL